MANAMDVDVPKEEEEEWSEKDSTFKKPSVLEKLPKKCAETDANKKGTQVPNVAPSDLKQADNSNVVEQEPAREHIPPSLNYIEPSWGGVPDQQTEYSFEVIKSGVIVQRVVLVGKPYWVFGRLSSCDIYMAHPTISRHHVVLQYRKTGAPDQPPGFYIYDLGSTHGTFLNKSRIKPKMYVRIQVGHILKLGCSTRNYILAGPPEDVEPESELSVTELKAKRAEELRARDQQQAEAAAAVAEAAPSAEEQAGVNWGMGEDADEETDLAVNPYAETNNEELYVDDPKKTLRGFMEREGHELRYEVSERGPGHFLCTVALPLDDARGRPVVAEALVRGKKKEAVVQCALEACRILDRHGVLRQATHQSRKRKAKDWEENDYYDSDEDTFLDRTGTIERKREQRMRAKQQRPPETYQTLVAKEKQLTEQIRIAEKQVEEETLHGHVSSTSADTDQMDSLDQYMNELNTAKKCDKYTLAKRKMELAKMQKEHAEVVRLMNIARPADLPPLLPQSSDSSLAVPSTSGIQTRKPKSLPLYGKRLKVKVTVPARNIPQSSQQPGNNDDDDDDDDDDDNDNDEKASSSTQHPPQPHHTETQTQNTNTEMQSENSRIENDGAQRENGESERNVEGTEERRPQSPAQSDSDNETSDARETRKGIIEQLEIKVALCDEKALASLDNKVKAKISKTVTKLRKIAEEEESIVVDEKRLAVQKRKIFEQLSSAGARDIERHLKLSHALSKMTSEFCLIGDRKLKIVEEINKLADDINNIAVEIRAASQAQRDQAVDRMKQFVEKAHRQQAEIFGQLEQLHNSIADQSVLAKLTELYHWLCAEKAKMLDNLDTLKNTKITENSQLLQDIIQFEVKSDNFVTTILKELKKIRKCAKLESGGQRQGAESSQTPSTPGEQPPATVQQAAGGDTRKAPPATDKRKGAREKKHCAEDKDCSMWVPPEGQTGDGRTPLNDKFGY